MPLPNNDPSLPSNPAPIFNDTEAVRGDQLRAAMQLIWGNLQYLFDFTGRTTDTLTEGLTNLYFTAARAIGSALTGFVSGADSAIAATDTILQAFGKTQGQITATKTRVTALESFYESSEQTVAFGSPSGSVSVAHGLGAAPKLVIAVLRCKTAENGYSVGDEIFVASNFTGATGQPLVQVWANLTDVGVTAYTSVAQYVANKTTASTGGPMTEANWRWVLRAWKI